jgi:hydroxysqualene dehydroxylase
MAHIGVIGGGWAGLAAAVQATRQGHRVTLWEMAAHVGGRARTVSSKDRVLDNGQHILIGAYTQTLELMRVVGVDVDQVLMRRPLTVVFPDGKGLRLGAKVRGTPPLPQVANGFGERAGPQHLAAMRTLWAFGKAVLGYSGWSLRDKWGFVHTSSKWALNGFTCDNTCTVAQLTAHLPHKVRTELLDPLCVAALNTPAAQASAQVFLRVLKDALLSGPGSSDLLLPRVRLGQLWPQPAAQWLARAGAAIVHSHRVERIAPSLGGWLVDGAAVDGVVLACTASEAARLVEPHVPAWAKQAHSLDYEPIITVYAQSPQAQLPEPMMALYCSDLAPAQYVFDLGVISDAPSVLAFVISGAAAWVAQGQEATVRAVLAQGEKALASYLRSPLVVLQVLTEKRATFLCTPGLKRPNSSVLPGCVAAGDYVDGPYPATLEGAMRSGVAAARALHGHC